MMIRFIWSGIIALFGAGWLAFLLAELGVFNGWLVLVALVGLAIALPVAWPIPTHLSLSRVEWGFLAGWLAITAVLVLRVHPYLVGAADAGVYTSLSAVIARDGAIHLDDPLLAELDEGLLTAVVRDPTPTDDSDFPYLLPGFYVTDTPSEGVTPQFYHLHPIWMAVGQTVAGTAGALRLTSLWGVLSALMMYLWVRSWSQNELTAVGATLALTLNPLFLWFTRYPTAESLTLFLFLAGAWGMSQWLTSTPSGVKHHWALLAGLAWGQLFLVRIDTLFILPILGLFVVWRWAMGWQKSDTWFTVPLALLVAHSLLHAWVWSQPYFVGLFGFAVRLFTVYWFVPLLATLFGIGGLVIIGRFRGQWDRLARYEPTIRWGLFTLTLLLAIYGYFVRPIIGEAWTWTDTFSTNEITWTNPQNLVRLGWYFSSWWLWVCLIGLAWAWQKVRKETAVFLLIGSFFTLFYLWDIRANPHHIYAMRRYMPYTLPLLAVGGAFWLQLSTQKAWRWGTLSLLVLLLGASLANNRQFILHIDYSGLAPQLASLNEQFDPNAVLLFAEPNPIGPADVIGTPLKYIYGRDMLPLRNLEQLDQTALARQVGQWQANGRSVYWVGDVSYLEEQFRLAQTHTITIVSQHLEGTYDRKPTQLAQPQWDIFITEMLPNE